MSDKPKPGIVEQIIAKRRQSIPPPGDGRTAEAGGEPVVSSPAPVKVERSRAATGDGGTEDSFSTANPPRRQKHPRLNFILKDGSEISYPYMDLRPIAFDLKARIILKYPGECIITLEGRNLQKLKRRLDREDVGTIREVDEFTDKATGNGKATAVYRITIKDL